LIIAMAENEGVFTNERKILLIVFIAGIIIGGLIVNQFVDPFLNSGQLSDANATIELNNRLDSRNDELFQCLVDNGIDPDTC